MTALLVWAGLAAFALALVLIGGLMDRRLRGGRS